MKRFHSLMNARPILMGSMLSGVITVLGDLGSQKIEKMGTEEPGIVNKAPQQINIDQIEENHTMNPFARSASMFLWGYAISFPLMFWYKRLDIWFPIAKNDSRLFEFKQVMSKLLTHQVCVPIALNIGFFTYVQSLDHYLHPHTQQSNETLLEKVKAKLNQDLLTTMIRSAQLWCPANLINFYVVPLPYRILFANMVGAIWIMYLSYVAHLKVGHDEKVAEIELL
mmetsp:Transcript_12807/g.19294  ORF Transcript_12807/g.19294 Transcript_12807/m.19294 type:complete len:225 (+) Transcript_12807:2649-3323(+)